MDGYLPLKPGGPTQVLAMTSNSPLSATLLAPFGLGEQSFLFDNSANAARAWLGYGATSGAAVSATAVIASGAVGPNVIPIAGNSVQLFTLQGGVFAAAMLESNLGSMPVLSGDGV